MNLIMDEKSSPVSVRAIALLFLCRLKIEQRKEKNKNRFWKSNNEKRYAFQKEWRDLESKYKRGMFTFVWISAYTCFFVRLFIANLKW